MWFVKSEVVLARPNGRKIKERKCKNVFEKEKDCNMFV